MNQSVTALARAEGGRPGSRLAQKLGLQADRMTLLRLVRAAPDLEATTPTALGVDDFALRRGRIYGTILYDLQRHVVIDLLPDRSPQSLTSWLLAHPGAEILSRDRAETYAQGARERAPNAPQTFLDRLTAKSALFATLRGLAEGFCALIRKRLREDARISLGLWVEEALSSCVAPLASFAHGLRDDWEAVVAGMSLPWSQGPVEGTVNQLKMIKRQMFGRANFDLLRKRVLPAA